VWAAWNDTAEPKPPGPLLVEDLQPEPEHTPTRCGRWARLHAVGAAIRAHENPTELVLLGAPKPVGWRWEQPPGARRPVWSHFDTNQIDAEESKKRRSPLDRLRALRQCLGNAVDETPEPEPNVLSTVGGDVDMPAEPHEPTPPGWSE